MVLLDGIDLFRVVVISEGLALDLESKGGLVHGPSEQDRVMIYSRHRATHCPCQESTPGSHLGPIATEISVDKLTRCDGMIREVQRTVKTLDSSINLFNLFYLDYN